MYALISGLSDKLKRSVKLDREIDKDVQTAASMLIAYAKSNGIKEIKFTKSDKYTIDIYDTGEYGIQIEFISDDWEYETDHIVAVHFTDDDILFELSNYQEFVNFYGNNSFVCGHVEAVISIYYKLKRKGAKI